MAVARNDLRRYRLDRKVHFFGDTCLDSRINIGKCADCARNGAGCNSRARRNQARAVTVKFGIGLGHFEAECCRLCVNGVTAPDAGRHFVLHCTVFQCPQQGVNVGEQNIGGAGQLHIEAGVQHVRGGHALMHKTRFRPNMFGKRGQKCDDIMFNLALNFINARDIKGAALAHGLGSFRRYNAKLHHGIHGMRFDIEPDRKAAFGFPQCCHFGAGITRNHK